MLTVIKQALSDQSEKLSEGDYPYFEINKETPLPFKNWFIKNFRYIDNDNFVVTDSSVMLAMISENPEIIDHLLQTSKDHVGSAHLLMAFIKDPLTIGCLFRYVDPMFHAEILFDTAKQVPSVLAHIERSLRETPEVWDIEYNEIVKRLFEHNPKILEFINAEQWNQELVDFAVENGYNIAEDFIPEEMITRDHIVKFIGTQLGASYLFKLVRKFESLIDDDIIILAAKTSSNCVNYDTIYDYNLLIKLADVNPSDVVSRIAYKHPLRDLILDYIITKNPELITDVRSPSSQLWVKALIAKPELVTYIGIIDEDMLNVIMVAFTTTQNGLFLHFIKTIESSRMINSKL